MTWMSTTSLARSFVLNQQNKALTSQMGQLAQELSTGQVADIGRATRGDYAPLAQIRHDLTMLEAFKLAGSEAATRADALQNSLTGIKNTVDSLANDLLISGTTEQPNATETAGVQARNALENIVSALNVTAAGQSLFAGAATDQPAIASADTILEALKVEIAGLTSADQIFIAVDAWFDIPGGGYATDGFLGTDAPTGAVRLAPTQTLSLAVSAIDPEMREVLKAVSAAALAEDPAVLAGDPAARGALIETSATRVLNAAPDITKLSSDIGVAQNRIETIQAENAAQRYVLGLAETEITGADPYETATRLQAVETQLQTHYTVTARLSGLSLVNYLR